jgi:nucleoside 2-deoxyribosyltransferase
MNNAVSCPICGVQATYGGLPGVDGGEWLCSRCGKFQVTGTAESILRNGTRFPRTAISGWIRDQNRAGIVPTIHSDNLNALASLRVPPLRERLDRYLIAAASMSKMLGADFDASDQFLIGSTYSDASEMGFLVRCLEDEGALRHRPGGRYQLTAQGYIAADELRSRRAASSQGFVAMWFSKEMATAFEDGFAPAILAAGYEPLRIDKKEHANKIDDEIIAEIRRSAFVVADFTGHRGGVYFEAGFAVGLGLPVIWTCRKDNIEQLHFDIRQYNCIDWRDANDLKERLRLRIEALLGRGPLKGS